MANMYPKNISEYLPTDSERIVYQELKNQFPDTLMSFILLVGQVIMRGVS